MVVGCWLYMLIGIVLSTSGGVLIKNGQVTSCDIITIGQVAAFVSANCLDFTKHMQLDNSTSYEVTLLQDDGFDYETRKLSTNNIHVHPEYNAQNLENNIAVIQFGAVPPSILSNIAATQFTTGSVLYKRLVAFDVEHGNAEITFSSNATRQCYASSELYKANTWAFTCTISNLNITSDDKAYPHVPYGSGSIIQGKYSISLYSHSVVENEEYWESPSMVSYYTMVSHYLQFANSKLKTKISYYDADKKLETDVSEPWKLTLPQTQQQNIIVGGDLYLLQDAADDNESSNVFTKPEASITLTASSESPESSSLPASEETVKEANNKGKSLSSGAIAGIVIGAVAFLVLLSLAIYWGSQVAKKRKAEAYWDKEMENMKSMRSLAQHPTSH
ncbi:hypothetical protein LPJ68_002894 [Coemansia sp. RSA 1086]|nr:hypothetical protein LPJ68_002894 [Coemansia sp. RSA 1086]